MEEARDPDSDAEGQAISAAADFPTTQWSGVLAAGHGSVPGEEDSLERLCRAYWYPLYSYVRRQGHSPEDAQDLTQDFFARFLENRYVKLADPARGRFRTFLLTALKHFLANEWKKSHRQKRGSGRAVLSLDAGVAEQSYAVEPVDEMNPEIIYERRWAITLLERVLQSLQREWTEAGKGWQFEELKEGLWGGDHPQSYSEIATRHGTTETAVKMAAHRSRQRYRELLRDEVAHTVVHASDVDEELRHLIAVISG